MESIKRASGTICTCGGCGKIIGVMGEGVLTIRHRGREIEIIPQKNSTTTVKITCDGAECKKKTEILVKSVDNQ